MKGWHKESYRHYLAAKGIKTNRYFRRQKAMSPQEFQALLSKEKPQGAYSRAEITPARRSQAKKTNLLREEEYLVDALTILGHDPDLEIHEVGIDKLEPHIANLYSSLDVIRQKSRRTQGKPPFKDVTGKTSVQLREGLYGAHAGTSTKKSQKLKAIIGVDLEVAETPVDVAIKKLRQRKFSSELANIKRVEPIIEAKAIEAAIAGEPIELTLEDVKRGTRGRKREYYIKK